jgi:hypothetical protein
VGSGSLELKIEGLPVDESLPNRLKLDQTGGVLLESVAVKARDRDRARFEAVTGSSSQKTLAR